MAEEEEKKAAILDCILKSSERRRKRLRRKFMRRKGSHESMLRITLLNAAHKRMKNFMEKKDSVPAIGVSIGGYNRFTGKDVTVSASFLYKIRQLHWEIVEGPLRRRLCVKWNGIHRLELKLNECGLACLTVEVNRPLEFAIYKSESKRWSHIKDFTDDDEIQRNLPPHYVIFKPGIVDESYETFLNYRKELALLKKEKHIQRSQKMQTKKQAILREEKLKQFLESKLHRQQLEKKENK